MVQNQRSEIFTPISVDGSDTATFLLYLILHVSRFALWFVSRLDHVSFTNKIQM